MRKSNYIGKRKIDINQKSFSFTHRYDQRKFKIDKLNNIKNTFQIKINNRLILSSIIFSSIFFVIAIQILQINIFHNAQYEIFSKSEEIVRPNILDRNSISLTANLPMYNIGVIPSKIQNREKFIRRAVSIYDHLSYAELNNKFQKNEFFYLKRNSSPQELQKIINIGEIGIQVEDSILRKYIHKSLFSHVIGEVDLDNIGVSGMEYSFNDIDLNSQKDTIFSSLDLRIQHIMRDEILKGMNTYDAKGGSGLIINVDNGEIISMVSLPDFDPNQSIGNKFNRNTLGVYELGSVMKTFTTAIGIEEKIFNLNTIYNVEKTIKVGSNRVSDTHSPCKQNLCSVSVEDIFVHSSNIGTIKMVRDIGTELQQNYLSNLGLLNKVNLNLPELATPIMPENWSSVSTDSIAYGYGLSISPLHLALATATVLNGGYIIEPTLLKNEKLKDYKQRIFSEDTSQMMRYLFSKVVTEGTAKSAFGYNKSLTYKPNYVFNDTYGYLVGGKTGTAQKSSSGYKRGKIATFISAFPINNPKFIVLISLDEPQPINDRESDYDTFGSTNAGWNVARISRNIIDRISPILDINTKYKLNDNEIIYNTSFN